MFAHSKSCTSIVRSLLIPVLIAPWLPLLDPSPLRGEAGPCASVIPLVPGETWRGPGDEAGGSSCFSVYLGDEGVLALGLSVSADTPQARLSLAAPSPIAGKLTSSILQQSATHLVMKAPVGRYLVRVEAEDPRQALSPFRLRVRFVAGRFPAGLSKSETDSELEIEPDLFLGAECRSPVSKSETDSELEIEPDLFVTGSGLCGLCRQEETDDHGDDFLCATPLVLGHSVTGEIGNGWGDDRDVFRIRLESLTTVEVRAWGESEFLGELYDRHGQRLEGSSDTREGLRLVRTLVPGTYFISIGGRNGAKGRYALRLRRGTVAPGLAPGLDHQLLIYRIAFAKP